MFFQVLKFAGWKEGRHKLSGILSVASILLILSFYYDELIVLKKSFFQVPFLDHILILSFLILSLYNLICACTYRQRLLKKIVIKPDVVLELTIDRDSVSLDEQSFLMDDVIRAEVYSNKKYTDLYMAFPSNQSIRKHSYIWVRLTPGNLIYGNHHALPLFLKKRLGDRIRVFVTTS